LLALIKEPMMYRQAAVLDEHDLFLPAAQIGDGWWSDVKHGVSNVAGKVANVAKKIQKSSVVRGLEKKAVDYGTKALRDVAEPAVDALADTAATALGNPELAAPLDLAIHKGADYLQKKGADYLDQKIDASGNGLRYTMPSGSGMRVAGSHTQIANGLRLASGSGMRSLSKHPTRPPPNANHRSLTLGIDRNIRISLVPHCSWPTTSPYYWRHTHAASDTVPCTSGGWAVYSRTLYTIQHKKTKQHSISKAPTRDPPHST
jgi:hypothetical protein